jgi:type II secretory ATPase GspE/PulE/Tfp pilus assembly ATPase PilB-like protein
LRDITRIPIDLHPAIVSRIKILSKLKIDEQRIPQDGRFDVNFHDREVDIRVSTLPTANGEKVVLRLLDKSFGILTLEQLGLQGKGFNDLIREISKPHGVILATGPTGCGKTTTLYAILNRVKNPTVNIVTLEDPVEYEIDGINQSQIRPDIGFSFATGLRSILRQDPNIIMVGEIRDTETAQMVTHAALTGHLVLTTLHTNEAASALPRLINMGVEPFLITTALNAIIAQRLLRRICQKCQEEVKLGEAVLNELEDEIKKMPPGTLESVNLKRPFSFRKGKGCDECDNKGYKGRIGIFEVLVVTPAIEDLAVKRRPASEIHEQAIKQGMLTMRQDGILKVLQGLTTYDEVLRVTTTE